MNNVPHLTVFIWKHTAIQNIGTLALAEKRDLNELLSRRSILEIVGLFYVAHTFHKGLKNCSRFPKIVRDIFKYGKTFFLPNR